MTGNKYQDALNEAQIDVPGANAVFGARSLPPSRAARASANMNALVKREDGAFVYKRFVITPVGMQIPDDATDDELMEIGAILEELESSVTWNIGDWFNRADRIWGQMYDTSSSEAQLRYQTLRAYAWVARNVPLLIRNQQLSFSHHRLIASLVGDMDLQRAWLDYAAAGRFKLAEMKKQMQAVEALPAEAQLKWVRLALSERALLTEFPEFKRPALPEDVRESKRTITRNAAFIADVWDKVEQLDGAARKNAIDIGLNQRRMVDEYLRRLGVK